MVAIGDGALGFWSAVRDVWSTTVEQRDWCHKMVNVPDKLPKRLQPRAKRMLREAMYAPTRADAVVALDAFAVEFGAKYPKAVECVRRSPFSTVRLRQRVTKGAGSRTKGLLMAFKLLDMAQLRWRKLDGSQLLPLVRAGVKFVDGVQQERDARNAA